MEYWKDDEVRPPAPVTNAPVGETEEVDAVAATLAAKLIHIVHRVALCSQVFGSTGLALVPGAGQVQGEHLGQTQLYNWLAQAETAMLQKLQNGLTAS